MKSLIFRCTGTNINPQLLIMKPIKSALIGFVLILTGCDAPWGDAKDRYKPMFPKDMSVNNERENKLFVFVGEKIDTTHILDFSTSDSHIKARYLVLQRIYGYYEKDTIEFDAYDHFGRFKFANFRHVILYVSEYDNKFVHSKYMYDPVYKTKDGRWAGPYSEEYDHPYNKGTKIMPQKINFAEEVSFPTKVKDIDGTEYTVDYPEPYYRISGGKAIAVYGNFVPELFMLKKESVLTARELFGDTIPEIDEVEIKEWTPDTTGKK